MNIFTTLLIEPLANGLILFYRLFGGNMGLAIIGFSLFLRIILSPLTKPYMRSMKKIKDAEPQLAKLRAKHKNDRAALMKAQADFYKEKGINPGAGCLPYLLQIVVLIAFFNVFARTLIPNGDVIERFNELLYQPLVFSQEETINTQFLYLELTLPDKINIPDLPFPLPGPVIVLAAIVQFLSAKMMLPFVEIEKKIAKKTKTQTDDMQVAMQKSMIYMFPMLTLVIGLQFASGLALYWLMFSLYQIWQQYHTSGWGGLTPWLRKLGLLQSVAKK